MVDAGAAHDADLDADVAAPSPSSGYDVFLLAGQSNMVGRGASFDAALDTPHPAIFQWGRGERDGMIVPAVARLDHNDTALLDRVGMGLSFAKAYYEASQPTPRPILLVPTARGGSSFSAHQWNPGDPLFEDAVLRGNAAMATDPGNRFVAFLWHQGENDVGQYDNATYSQALDAMIGAFRARVAGASSAPFILGQFCPDWSPDPAAKASISSAIDATPQRVPFTSVAPSAGLTSNAGDAVHFDAPAQRTYGARYWQALDVARANVPHP
ncbi:Phage protein [Labilithrix luteola]|uniref:Phage protein n=1 Tax=Labilithrix luteola TaxID=1391654 RepID=A0A0K1PM06_9BACT|nr:Phage protein [Labilithrix luteola]